MILLSSLMGFGGWLKDLRRGFNERDLLSAQLKLQSGCGKPGGWVEMTDQELAALLANRQAGTGSDEIR